MITLLFLISYSILYLMIGVLMIFVKNPFPENSERDEFTPLHVVIYIFLWPIFLFKKS